MEMSFQIFPYVALSNSQFFVLLKSSNLPSNRRYCQDLTCFLRVLQRIPRNPLGGGKYAFEQSAKNFGGIENRDQTQV